MNLEIEEATWIFKNSSLLMLKWNRNREMKLKLKTLVWFPLFQSWTIREREWPMCVVCEREKAKQSAEWRRRKGVTLSLPWFRGFIYAYSLFNRHWYTVYQRWFEYKHIIVLEVVYQFCGGAWLYRVSHSWLGLTLIYQ